MEIFKFSVFEGSPWELRPSLPVKPRPNGRNIVTCYMLRPFAHPIACFTLLYGCWELSRKV